MKLRNSSPEIERSTASWVGFPFTHIGIAFVAPSPNPSTSIRMLKLTPAFVCKQYRAPLSFVETNMRSFPSQYLPAVPIGQHSSDFQSFAMQASTLKAVSYGDGVYTAPENKGITKKSKTPTTL